MPPKPRIDVHVLSDDDIDREWIRGIAERVLEEESYEGRGTLAVLFVDDD